MKLPVKATETKSGKGKVIDDYGFSVCNISGGSYKEQRMVAAEIAKAVNYHDRLREALGTVVDALHEQDPDGEVIDNTVTEGAVILLAEIDNLEQTQ